MQAKKTDLQEDETTTRTLMLIIQSRVMTMEGTWHFQKESLASAKPFEKIAVDFNYVFNVDANNYLVHPDDIGLVRNIERTPNIVHTLSFRLVSSEGGIHELHLAGSFIPMHHTPPPQDEVIKAKEALVRQALAKYQELFISIDQGFAIVHLLFDEDGNPNDYYIDQTNPAFEKITGLKNITGKRLREILPVVPQGWLTTLGKIVHLQKPARLTVKSQELSGVWYDIYAFPTGDPSSKKLGLLFTDITDRILAEEKLRDKQLKLEIAQREARVGIWTYHPSLDQGMATEEWMELTGYPGSPETWSLEIFLSLIVPEDVPVVRHAFESTPTRPWIEVEFRIEHPKRGLQWFLMRGSYIASDSIEKDALMGSIIDITDRKAFEEQKDQFIGIVSHELKTPVTSIKAYAEILKDFLSRKGESEQSRMMERMVNQVDRLTRLINDLLDTTRITGGGLILEPETLDLNKLIHDRIEEIQNTTNHAIVVQTQPLPPVVADKDRIGQVLMNLVSNAIKYSPPDSDIIVRSEKTDDHIIVSVRDFGIGLPPDAMEKIFDRFYRVRNTSLNATSGLGLGLFIASEIVKRHNGTMGVKSKEGEGSEFHFRLPL